MREGASRLAWGLEALDGRDKRHADTGRFVHRYRSRLFHQRGRFHDKMGGMAAVAADAEIAG